MDNGQKLQEKQNHRISKINDGGGLYGSKFPLKYLIQAILNTTEKRIVSMY